MNKKRLMFELEQYRFDQFEDETGEEIDSKIISAIDLLLDKLEREGADLGGMV